MHAIRRGIMVSALWCAYPGFASAEPQPAPEANEPEKSVAQLNEEGAALYQQREYRRAIERFIQAYAIDPDPNLLFNVARSYERLGEVDLAIEKYEAFLASPGADAAGRARAEESLRLLRRAKGERSAEPAPSVPAPSAAEGGGAAEREADPAQSPSALPWVTLGGGVLLSTVGLSLYLLGAADHGEITGSAGYEEPGRVLPMTRREAEDLVSAGDSKKLLGGIGLGVGGALIATSVFLLATGKPASGATDVAVAVDASPNSGRVSVGGSF